MSEDKLTTNQDELQIRFTAWITKLVRRAKIDYIRKLCKTPLTVPLDNVPDGELAKEQEIDDLFRSAESFEFSDPRIAETFSALSVFRQKILILLYVQDMTVEEAAAELGCDTKFVYNERRAAFKILRDAMGRK